MLNKTIRSVLALALAFCMVLGVSGNAIALAVSNPADGAIDKVDKEVNQIIADLEAKIADLEKEVEKQEKKLNDAKQKLDDGEARLPDDKALLKDKREQLEDAKQKLTEANVRLENAKVTLAGYETQLEELEKQLEVLESQLEALPEGAPGRADKLDEVNAKQAEVNAKQAEVEAKQKEVANAIDYIGELTDFVRQCDEKIAEYEAKIPVIEQDIADAKEILPKAEKAVKEAKEAVADAKTVVESIKTTYADLYDAVTSPEVSLSFVKDTYADLQNQMQDLWDDVLTLQTSLHELEDAYEELEGFEIEPITIEKFEFDGFEVETVTIDGQTFEGKKVEHFSVDGFTFNGFTAPTVDELTDISNKLDDVIGRVNTLNTALEVFASVAKKVIAKALDVAEEAIDLAYAVKNNLNKEGVKKVYNWLYNNPDKVCSIVKEFGVYGLELLVQYGPYALDLLNDHFDLAVLAMKLTAGGVYLTATLGAKALGYLGDKLDFLADYKGKIVDAARKLYAQYGDEAKALIKVYVEYLELEERYFNATHAELDICCGTKYVAVGDLVAYQNDYSELLTEKLYFNNYAGVYAPTVEEAVEMVGSNADVADADLITLGFGNLTAINAMVEWLLGDGSYDADWSAFDNEDIDDLVFKSLAELEAELVEHGMDAHNVAVVLDAAEAYTYAYLKQQLSYIKLVNEIQAVNPDAQIVIVGAYNELENVSIVVGSHTINVGKYICPLVLASNLQGLAEGFLNENVIFVDAPEVEKNTDELVFDLGNEMDQLAIVLAISDVDLLPSKAGHEYIADQIVEALDVEYHLWGDVNGDHKVNCRDARLVLKYAAGLITEDDLDLTWGDVNGDGKVNSRDARLILQMRAGQIEHFPVCAFAEK